MYDNMMNDVGMNGWMNGGMWIWPLIGTLVVVLIVIVVIKLSKK
ncbi:MAG: hypothetical protein ACSLFH_11205 [Desulfuromonadales bacterium]